MTKSEVIHNEIFIELEFLETTINELKSLQADVTGRKLTVRELTAASAFLAQFYNGIENILKRISKYYGIAIPLGEMWHLELFKRFCAPSYKSLPVLFDQSLSEDLSPYRKFRHVVIHSYGFQIEWEQMVEGVESIGNIFKKFKSKVLTFLKSL